MFFRKTAEKEFHEEDMWNYRKVSIEIIAGLIWHNNEVYKLRTDERGRRKFEQFVKESFL